MLLAKTMIWSHVHVSVSSMQRKCIELTMPAKTVEPKM
jgi:hypothetical protein